MLRRGVLASILWTLLCVLPARANLLARVEPSWSPFLRAPVLKGAEGADLVAEARELLLSQPARVAQVLGRQPLPRTAAGRISRGLWADALYQAGLPGLSDAQKLYREVVTSSAPPDEEAWAEFMLGNIRLIQGFTKEAEVAYRACLKGPAGPWRPAAVFDLGAIFLEAGRPLEARSTFQEWLREHSAEPGRALVLFLLAECHAALGETDAAMTRLAEARALSPDAWVVRPETGYALADVFRRSGNVEEAVRILEAVPRTHPGTLQGARARLAVGGIREAEGNVESAARAYGQLLDEGGTPEEGREALLRLALLGAEFSDRVRLRDSYPAYRTFYRPAATLEEAARDKDPLRVQRALRGLATLARREGRPLDALKLYARAFQESPKSPESGKAYEAFMECLESHLTERMRAAKPAEVIQAYEAFRGAVGWASSRDKGAVEVRAAEAYAALGAPKLARETYERLLRDGTRALSVAEIEARLLEIRAREGDPEAVKALAARRAAGGGDPRVEAALARRLATEGRTAEARDHFLRAAELATDPGARVTLQAEADLLSDALGRVDDHIKGLERRRPAVSALPAGANREAWETSGALSEARLKFSRGDYSGAIQAYGRVAKLAPEDTYILALAEKRVGREARARELFASLAKGPDPVIASLAGFHLQAAGTREAARKR